VLPPAGHAGVTFPPDALAYFRPGDASDLAAQVERLLVDPAAACRLAARADEVARAWPGSTSDTTTSRRWGSIFL